VAYPFDELLGALRLESHRARCLVVGEDLGVVPDGFRDRLAESQVLSYRVFWFERANAGWRRPEDYPTLAAACAMALKSTCAVMSSRPGKWKGSS